jgi:hypothetical protein
LFALRERAVKYFYVIQAAPGGKFWTFTVRENDGLSGGGNTSVTSTINDPNTKCSDPSSSAMFAAGNLISVV